MRILVVDDEPPVRFALSDYFTTKGCKVDTVGNVEEAKTLIESCEYAVVIADACLTPGYGSEGLKIISLVRQQSPDTRVIVLTAHGSPEIEGEARRLGAHAFLPKPKPLSELARLVFGLAGARTDSPHSLH